MACRQILGMSLFVIAAQAPWAGSSRMAAGEDHLLFIREDGSLWAMGADTYGQLGLKGSAPQPVPIQVGRDRWSRVSAGAAYSLALKPDGTLWAFGRNQAAQLGKGNRKDLETPKRVGTNLWLDMAAGNTVTLAIRSDGTLRVWGGWEKPARKGWYRGSLGESRQPARGKWKAVAAGKDHGLALKNDGTLWALGDNSLGQAGCEADPLGLHLCQVGEGKWKAIAASADFSVGIREDGTMWTWGSDSLGALGRKTTEGSYGSVGGGAEGGSKEAVGGSIADGSGSASTGMEQVGTDRWLAAQAGDHHVLALRNDSTLWAWGSGGEGALGLGGLESRNEPAQVGAERFQAIAAGRRFSAALRTDGQPMVWGDLGFASGTVFLVERPVAWDRWRESRNEPALALTGDTLGKRKDIPPPESPRLEPSRPTAAPEAVSAKALPGRPVQDDPHGTPPSWIGAHKGWLVAGGSVLIAGSAVMAFWVLERNGKSAAPADLGTPPGDPVAQEGK